MEDLQRRKRRAGLRRRAAAAVVSAAVAGAASILVVRAFAAQGPGAHVAVIATWPALAAPTGAHLSATAACPEPTAESPPAMVLSPTRGVPGSSIEVSGRFVDDELWVQLWWNADWLRAPEHVAPPPWPPAGPHLQFPAAGPGPVLELGSVTGPDGNCTFRTKMTVPNVPPGTYQVSGVSGFGRPQGDAYALSVTTVDFEVDR